MGFIKNVALRLADTVKNTVKDNFENEKTFWKSQEVPLFEAVKAGIETKENGGSIFDSVKDGTKRLKESGKNEYSLMFEVLKNHKFAGIELGKTIFDIAKNGIDEEG